VDPLTITVTGELKSFTDLSLADPATATAVMTALSLAASPSPSPSPLPLLTESGRMTPPSPALRRVGSGPSSAFSDAKHDTGKKEKFKETFKDGHANVNASASATPTQRSESGSSSPSSGSPVRKGNGSPAAAAAASPVVVIAGGHTD
jgi:hypothetical protein